MSVKIDGNPIASGTPYTTPGAHSLTLDADTTLTIQAWGAGGNGINGTSTNGRAGGGGGGYSEATLLLTAAGGPYTFQVGAHGGTQGNPATSATPGSADTALETQQYNDYGVNEFSWNNGCNDVWAQGGASGSLNTGGLRGCDCGVASISQTNGGNDPGGTSENGSYYYDGGAGGAGGTGTGNGGGGGAAAGPSAGTPDWPGVMGGVGANGGNGAGTGGTGYSAGGHGGVVGSTAGQAGTAPGGGGGGGAKAASGNAGGAGANGQIIFSWSAAATTATLAATAKRPAAAMSAAYGIAANLAAQSKKPGATLSATYGIHAALAATAKRPSATLSANYGITASLAARSKLSSAALAATYNSPIPAQNYYNLLLRS
ncbi:MAG: hypothetical protein ABSG68_26725 [Thermoguttaceae bacterium]|jgi:hypothetical protein